MSTLFEKPPENTAVTRIVGGGVIAFATMAVLSLMWWTLSPILGQVYVGIRLAETLVLWKFTGWGRYFTSMPAGQPFAFVSIYKSSVAFGVVATLVTLLIGFLAWRKRNREHIEVVIAALAKTFTMPDVLDCDGRSKRYVRRPAAQDATGVVLSPVTPNPFQSLRDLRDLRSVEAVADQVPWHLAGALALVMDASNPLKDASNRLKNASNKMKDGKRREAIQAAAWNGTEHFINNSGAEPPSEIVTALRSHMVLAIAEMARRDVQMLDAQHKILKDKPSLPSAIASLAKRAESEQKLRFSDYAWLRPVDATLHTTICSL